MFEDLTYELILQRLLGRVSDSIDKREGSIIYDALAPAAAEMRLIYITIEQFYNDAFADTAQREYLIRRAAERGLLPKSSSQAICKGVFNINIPEMARFSNGNLNYVANEKMKDFEYKMICESSGSQGNIASGNLIPIDYIEGLEFAYLDGVLTPGENIEDTEDFRKRYFDNMKNQPFGGNIADYKEKVNKINGVGGSKVIPVWKGSGTVKIIVIDSDFNAPTTALVKAVQEEIDPVLVSGIGKGIAPIGHKVTVVGATVVEVSISCEFLFQAGYAFIGLKASMLRTIADYFTDIKRNWSVEDTIIIRSSRIENRLLDLVGVVDIGNLKINGIKGNFVLSNSEIPKLNEVLEVDG